MQAERITKKQARQLLNQMFTALQKARSIMMESFGEDAGSRILADLSGELFGEGSLYALFDEEIIPDLDSGYVPPLSLICEVVERFRREASACAIFTSQGGRLPHPAQLVEWEEQRRHALDVERFRLLHYEWNVSAAHELVRRKNRPVDGVARVAELYEMVGRVEWDESDGNGEYRRSGRVKGIIGVEDDFDRDEVDLSVPLIGVTLPDGNGNIVIDGWKRIVTAHERGIEALPVHLLTAEEEKEIRLFPID